MKYIKRGTTLLLGFLVTLILLDYLFPLDTQRLKKPKSTLIYDTNHHLMALKLSSDGFLRIPIKKTLLETKVKEVVTAYEDQYFEEHFGVNPLSIVRAIYFNLTNQRKIGASTITMQVARMMHNKPRTFSQKLIEIFQAFQLEWHYSKDEILTFYLNNAPYGGNVEGFASASFRYFNLEPSSLSLSQIAYLCSIPKNPNANRPKKGRDINTIKNRLLHRLYELNLLKEKEYKRALREKISVDIQNLPNQVPHLTAHIKQAGEVNTTINMPIQKEIEKLIKTEIEKLKKFNIHNGAALVIENQTMNIVAYVASQDFYDTKYGGQNDGIRALISPGSTLKPFVYARALEEGFITPLKKVFDVPLFIEGYKPMNYTREYQGEVTASEALQLSLNIPAVELDRHLKKRSLYHLLKEVNVRSLNHSKSYYGASLTLGGVGLSLKDNAELFAMLANGGVFQRASYLKNSTKEAPKSVLKKEACYLVSTILADAPRLSFSSTWEKIKGMSKIAFKTGTSAHAKDMLTIGYTPKYTVAVWYGNFLGVPSKKYQGISPTGLKVASPTLFKIFNILGKQPWFVKPKGVITKELCQDAIKIGACKQRVKELFIKGVTLKDECKTMRAEVLSYLKKQNIIDSILDLKNHRCYKEWKSYKPLITSPINGKTYTYNKALPEALKKSKLECYSFEANSTIYWIIDNKEPIQSTSGRAIYLYLTPKKHNISCLDEAAKARDIEFFNEEL